MLKIKNQWFKKTKIFFFFLNLLAIITSFWEGRFNEDILGLAFLTVINIYIVYSLFSISKNDIKYDVQKENSNVEENNLQNKISEKSTSSEVENGKQSRIATLDKQIMSREKFIIDTELKYIDNMNGIEFEKYITELFIKLGYDALTTKASNDDGVDVIAEKGGIKYAIQCKNYSQPVGNKAVQEVYTSKGLTQSDVAIVLTNNKFTSSAIREAEILGIQLWDRDKLTTLLYTAFHFDFRNIDNTVKKSTKKMFNENVKDDNDPFLNDAIEAVIEIGQASTSFIQRRFKVNYARAGRIIDQMEARGIVSGYSGSKPREVLITKERWQKLQNKQ